MTSASSGDGRTPGLKLWKCFAVFVVAMSLIGAIVAWIGNRISGPDGVQAALMAWAVCVVSGLVVFPMISALRRIGANPVVEAYASMGVRMGLALGAAVLFFPKNSAAYENGVLYYLVGIYVVTLWLEVLLVLPPSDEGPRE